MPAAAIGSSARAELPVWATWLLLEGPSPDAGFVSAQFVGGLLAEERFHADRPGRFLSVSFFTEKKSRNLPKGCRVLGAC